MPANEWTAWERGVAAALLDARGELVEVNRALQQHVQGSPRTLNELIHAQDWPGLRAGQWRVRLQPGQLYHELSLTGLEDGWLAQFTPCSQERALREFHHRAKNHLAVISSVLQMQANLLSEPLVKQAFADCQTRVQCLALLYDLVQPESGRLDFAQHLPQLVAVLLDGRPTPNLELGPNPVILSIDQAVPLSLIAHELVGNSARHAEAARLEIKLEQAADERVCLTVADGGPGLPAHVETAQARSLGLRLVRTLSRQLRAQVQWESGSGTRCRLVFLPREEA